MSHEGNDWLDEMTEEMKEWEEFGDVPIHIETDEEYARRVASINMEGIENEELCE